MVTTAEINAQNEAFIKARAAAAAAGTSTTTTANKSEDAFSQLSKDKTFFLKMLTTQLKNQDPTQPFDTQQMSQQIAQYTGVEQQVQTNANLEKLLASNLQSQAATAVGYIAREVEYEGNTGQVIGGQGAFSYSLPSAGTSAEIIIKNSTGSVVFQGPGTSKEGRNILVWDGMNSTTGAQEPDGMYTLSVSAKDATGKDLAVTLKSVGIVSGVATAEDGTINLDIGNTQVALSKIQTIRTPTRIDLTAGEDSTSGGST